MNQWIDWHQSFLSFYSNQLIEHHHDWHCQDDPTNWLDYFRPFYSNLLNQIKFTSSKFFGVHDMTQPLLYSYWILFITLIFPSVWEKNMYILKEYENSSHKLWIFPLQKFEKRCFLFFLSLSQDIYTLASHSYIYT